MKEPTENTVETVRLVKVTENDQGMTIEFVGPKILLGFDLYAQYGDAEEEYMANWIELNELRQGENFTHYHRFCEQLIHKLYNASKGLR